VAINFFKQVGMVVQAYIPSSREAEAGG
jgi:hypothetical protein